MGNRGGEQGKIKKAVEGQRHKTTKKVGRWWREGIRS